MTDLAVWCRDFCEASGDARYCSVGDTLASLDDWRQEHDEHGGVPASLLNDIDHVINPWLPDVLDLDDPADASQLARTLRQELQSLLLGPEDWVERGYAERPDA